MIDYRVRTFLTLCDLMSYRKTAETLSISQPAVTQQIQYLERSYGCKLFFYENRRLTKTPAAAELEAYARSMCCNDYQVRQKLQAANIRQLRIGATRTIGDYVIGDQVIHFLRESPNALTVIVDNTEALLGMLNDNRLDFAVIEGFFDHKRYDSYCLRREPFVGICQKGHPFAGRSVSTAELLGESIIHQEEGTGTRAILERRLLSSDETLSQFRRKICVSSFHLILELVRAGLGISFVYKSLADSVPELDRFTIQGEEIVQEFNLVWLKGANVFEAIRTFFLAGGKGDFLDELPRD